MRCGHQLGHRGPRWLGAIHFSGNPRFLELASGGVMLIDSVQGDGSSVLALSRYLRLEVHLIHTDLLMHTLLV